MIGFFPFKTAADALANINSVSEGIVHDDLKLFLDTNLPKGGKGVVLGVSDSKLSASINDSCKVKCSHIGVIPEVIRGKPVSSESLRHRDNSRFQESDIISRSW